MDPEPGAAAPVGPCLGLGVPLLARQKPGVWGEEVARLALPAHWGQAPEPVEDPSLCKASGRCSAAPPPRVCELAWHPIQGASFPLF